jgi:hypothetical protein
LASDNDDEDRAKPPPNNFVCLLSKLLARELVVVAGVDGATSTWEDARVRFAVP